MKTWLMTLVGVTFALVVVTACTGVAPTATSTDIPTATPPATVTPKPTASPITTLTPTPSPTATLTPTPSPTATRTPTPFLPREWRVEGIQVDGSTVTVLLHVFAGIDVRATLDGRDPDQVNAPIPILEFVFLNVAVGTHTIQVKDVVGFRESAEVVVPPPAAVRQPKDGVCIPAAPLGLAVGHTWTLAGAVQADGNFSESSLPEGTSEVSTSYTVTAITDSEWVVNPGSREGGGEPRVLADFKRVQVHSNQVMRDVNGNVLDTQEQVLNGNTIYVAGLSPVLTLDWNCHQQAWLERPTTSNLPGGGMNSAEHTVEEKTLSSGITAVMFLQTLITSVPEQGLEVTTESAFGYDKLTGILVLTTQRSTGTRNGEPISLVMAQELVSNGTALPEWLTDLRQRLEKEPVANPTASITQYTYKGQTVYFVPQRCCDIFSDLFDESGNLIGHPDGGITGRGDGRVSDFFEERKDGKIIWEDERTSDLTMVQVPAPIESVEILILESFPPQYRVGVVSGLPNGCVSFAGYRVEPLDDMIQIEIVNWRPAYLEIMCDQVYSTVVTTIPLGTDFEPGKRYAVQVNDVTETFIAQ